jgi:hypothetical protein
MLIQKRVASEIIKRFNEINKIACNYQNFPYDNSGLLGARNQVYQSIPDEKEYLDELVSKIIEAYNYYADNPKKEVMCFMEPFVNGRIKELKNHANVYKEARQLVKRF